MAEEPLTKDQIEAIREYVTAPPSSHIAQRLVATIDAQLRADLARVTAERDREANDRQTAGDAWNDMRRQRDAALVERDTARADLAKLNRAIADERAAVAIAHERIAEVTAERDARPEISRKDAKAHHLYSVGSHDQPWAETVAGFERVGAALRAHAAGSGKGGDDA